MTGDLYTGQKKVKKLNILNCIQNQDLYSGLDMSYRALINQVMYQEVKDAGFKIPQLDLTDTNDELE